MTAGTFGEILSSGTVPKCAAEIIFTLQAPNAESEADLISAAVRALQGEPAVAEPVGGGSLVAKLSEAVHPEVISRPVVAFAIPCEHNSQLENRASVIAITSMEAQYCLVCLTVEPKFQSVWHNELYGCELGDVDHVAGHFA